ncbi:uncharacterized protein BDV17DRAFT_160845 [Aspergillus undulatus]|uniref:uncharacterized protein n=1 Tax=Aspergillus undulatus TaxID=1810928 RepID=UPI003CCCF2CF
MTTGLVTLGQDGKKWCCWLTYMRRDGFSPMDSLSTDTAKAVTSSLQPTMDPIHHQQGCRSLLDLPAD